MLSITHMGCSRYINDKIQFIKVLKIIYLRTMIKLTTILGQFTKKSHVDLKTNCTTKVTTTLRYTKTLCKLVAILTVSSIATCISTDPRLNSFCECFHCHLIQLTAANSIFVGRVKSSFRSSLLNDWQQL